MRLLTVPGPCVYGADCHYLPLLQEGLSLVRGPLLREPQEMPPRPDACTIDAVWVLLCACLRADPRERPPFAEVAASLGEARVAMGGEFASWLRGLGGG